MINENVLNALPQAIYQRLNNANEQYLELIGTRIKEIGEMTATDLHRLQRLQSYSMDVENQLERIANMNSTEIYDILEATSRKIYNASEVLYNARGIEFIEYAKNKELQRYVYSIARQTADECINLTQHTAFCIFDKNGEIVPSYFKENANKIPTSLSQTYTKVIDQAVTTAQMGVTDYQSAMRQTLKALSDSGIRTVDYATGYSRRLDTAVRQNVLWGMKQCNQGIADIVGEEIGADGFEISYHSNPRPSHEAMGGQQYSAGKAQKIDGVYYPSFEEVKGLLEEYGCLHFRFSIILGVSVPTYDDDELARLKENDKRTFEYEGKTYTGYEATQTQRKLETAMRKQKDRANIAKAAGDDDMRREAQLKITHLERHYKNFSDKAGLPTHKKRMSVSGFRRVKTKDDLKRNQLTLKNGNVIIKETNTKLIGSPNTITQNTNKKGGIDRNYYGADGKQYKQISNNNHGNTKRHPFGNNGEHAHDYIYDENGKNISRTIRELNLEERKENEDIL